MKRPNLIGDVWKKIFKGIILSLISFIFTIKKKKINKSFSFHAFKHDLGIGGK
jgi:hypothetical protein